MSGIGLTKQYGRTVPGFAAGVNNFTIINSDFDSDMCPYKKDE